MSYLNKKNKTIIVRSSPENSYYKQMKNALQSQSVSSGLEQRNLEIVEDTSANNNEFNFFLYGQDGALFLSENSYNDGTFNKLFDFVDEMTPKASQTGGGQVDYRQKYYKYKHKYDELRTVITSFESPQH